MICSASSCSWKIGLFLKHWPSEISSKIPSLYTFWLLVTRSKGIAAYCLVWVYTPLYHPAHRLVVLIPCSCKKSLCQVHTELVEQSSYFLPTWQHPCFHHLTFICAPCLFTNCPCLVLLVADFLNIISFDFYIQTFLTAVGLRSHYRQ